MSYQDRRDAEPPLTLDDRDRRRRAPRSGGPAPVTLIVSVLLLAAVAGGVFFMYRSGSRNAGQAPQPLGAPLGDVRAPAPPQAQTPDAAAGLTISKDDPNAPTAAPTLAPPPEQPLPEAATAPPPPPAASASAAVATAPPPPPPGAAAKTSAEKGDAIDRLIAQANTPKAAATTAKPATQDSTTAPVVQIGAFSSEALADKEWSKAAAVAPGAMAGKGKRVVTVNKDGATLYRTAITGFTSRDQATALCARLQAAGATCFVR
jgi:outer membrane biosynthesis protein TonB